MILRNVRQIDTRHGPVMAADFEIADGRLGCVSVSLAEFKMHGERALRDEAMAREAQAQRDGYRPPQHDRFSELD